METKRKNRISVSIFFFLAGFTFASWASRILDIKIELGLNEAQLGGILFSLPVGLMVSLLLAGALITKFGSRSVVIFSAVAYAVNLVMLALAPNIILLVTALFFMGLFGNMFNVSVNVQAIAVETLYKRSVMASFHGLWSLAGFTGAAFGTMMIALSVTPVFHFMLVAIIDFVLISLFYKNTITTYKSGDKTPAFILPDKTILQYGIIAFCCLVCEGTMFDWSGIYFQQAVKAPSQFISLGYAAFMGCMAAGRFFADKLIMKIGAVRMLQAAGIIIAAGLSIAIIYPSLVVATIGFMFVGFGVSSVVPIVYSLSGKSSSMNAGQAIAAVSTVGFAGFLIGPPMIGFISEATNIRWSFSIVAIIGLCTTLLSLRLPKEAN